MFTNTGKVAYLNSFEDGDVFDEFSMICKEIRQEIKSLEVITDLGGADIFQTLYSITCDLAPDKSIYKIKGFGACPKCHSENITTWGPIYPYEIIDCDISKVSHENWKKLKQVEKIDLSRQAIYRLLTKNDY